MRLGNEPSYVAFEDDRCIASGDLETVARAAKTELSQRPDGAILIFDGATGGPVEIDFRGSITEVLARLNDLGAPDLPLQDLPLQDLAAKDLAVDLVVNNLAGAPAAAGDDGALRGPGRPKLGVVAREVTLLPRHWQWLARQRGGSSATLRRLVDDARREGADKDRIRAGQERAYRFMSAIAGNRPHFEEAARALFAGEPARFEKLITEWPADVREHCLRLADGAFHQNRQPPAG